MGRCIREVSAQPRVNLPFMPIVQTFIFAVGIMQQAGDTGSALATLVCIHMSSAI